MSSNAPKNLYDLPIYKKALEICSLSQDISCCLTYDLAELNEDGSEDQDVYFSGDIVQQSVSLAPEILKAELGRHSTLKNKHTETINRLTTLLYKNSLRLERSKSRGKDYLPLLRRELTKFKQLQKSWMLSL